MPKAEHVAQHVIEEIINRRFPDGIVAVLARSDIDHYDDRVLNVQIIHVLPVPLATEGLIREIRSGLTRIGEDAFPILSFITKDEWEQKG